MVVQNRLALWIQRVLALALLALTVVAVADYPLAKVWLGAMLGAFALASLFLPAVWLLVLPLVLPLVNLASWSGRLFLEDFDFFVWVAIAAGLWHGVYWFPGRPRFTTLPRGLILLFLTTHCIALVRGLLPLPEIDGNAFNNYYSHYNALRVGKSLIWAVLLLPPLVFAYSTRRDLARRLFSLGVSLGLIGATIAVLWERGALADLVYGNGFYGKISGLTDFTSEYRITGLFSEMHTGGEAIDGYLSMSWPIALGLLLVSQGWWLSGAGLMAVSGGLYSALLTFSRGTYASAAVSMLTFALPLPANYRRRGGSLRGFWPLAFAVLGSYFVCGFLYDKGGYFALVAGMGIWSSGVVLTYLGAYRWFPPVLRNVGLGASFLLGFALMMRGLLTSKWVSNSWGDALLMSLPACIGLLAAGVYAGTRARAWLSLRGFGFTMAFAIAMIMVTVPVTSGSYIQSRFTTTGGDAGGRVNHWLHAIGLMNSDIGTTVLGMGLGVFPRAYLQGSEGEKSSVTALEVDQDSNTYLAMTNSMDLAVGQRVSLQGNEPYVLKFKARSDGVDAAFLFSVCRRLILVPWENECVGSSKVIKGTQWSPQEWQFNLGNLGEGVSHFRRPLTFKMTYFLYDPKSENNMPLHEVDIDEVSITDAYGEEYLVNGDFEQGMDLWFPTSDHYHLPLHPKNLWVNVFFEQGLSGLIAFCALVFYGLYRGSRLALSGDGFALSLLSSLMGALTVGVIGTLYDVPRVIFLFFLVLLSLLAQDPELLKSKPGMPLLNRRDREKLPVHRRPFVVKPIEKL